MTNKRPPLFDNSRGIKFKRAKTLPLTEGDDDRPSEASDVTSDSRDGIIAALDRRSTELAQASVSDDEPAETSEETYGVDSLPSLEQPASESRVGQGNEHSGAESTSLRQPESPVGREKEHSATEPTPLEDSENPASQEREHPGTESTSLEETESPVDKEKENPAIEPTSLGEPGSPVGQENEHPVAESTSSPIQHPPVSETLDPKPGEIATEEHDDDSPASSPGSRPSSKSSFSHWLDTVDKNNMFPHLSPRPGPWTAPPEPLRPKNPYEKELKLVVRSHTACPPFGDRYSNYPGIREEVPDKELRTMTQVELCLKNPPMEGKTAEGPPRSLQITDTIRVRDDAGAQLVVCRLDDEPTEYAAKIYDPLYYGFCHTMWSDQPRDVADEADKDYCREVAAYLELDDQVGGKDVPKYYGSWTFQMPLDLPDGSITRDIRMILMERIHGQVMIDIKADLYPEEVRLEALAKIVEALERVQHAGISHGDISQRNIMLCDDGAAFTIGRAVIIDFNYATVFRLDTFEEEWGRPHTTYEKPIHPIDSWWDGGLYGGFGDWVPESWEQRPIPMQQWLYQRWGKSEDYRPLRKPLKWDEENLSHAYCAW